MSPIKVEYTKATDLSSQKDEFPAYNAAAILELSSLLGIDTETLTFVILRNCDLEEGVLTSRLRARFQGMNSYQPVHESIEDLLENLGLDPSTSKVWNYVISKCSLEDNHLDLMDWVVLYMQDLIRYSLFPENIFGKFPYQESTENTWFKQARDQEEEEYYGAVNVLNRMTEKKNRQDEPYPSLDGKHFPEGIEEEGYELFYHGTNHISAVSILEDGINLDKGKAKQDFSDGNGFYLSNDFHKAQDWAFHTNTNKRAVLIFKIRNQVLDDFRGASINLMDDEDEWQRITDNFRSGQTKKFKKEMKRVSFIEGPMASIGKNPKGSVKNKGSIENSYQMCLHSHELACKFHFSLHSIVFFEKVSEQETKQ